MTCVGKGLKPIGGLSDQTTDEEFSRASVEACSATRYFDSRLRHSQDPAAQLQRRQCVWEIAPARTNVIVLMAGEVNL